MEKIIVAEKRFSQFKNAEAWHVGIKVESGKMYAQRDILEPIKAIRYMLMLSHKEFVKIDKESYELVKKANNELKAQAKAETEKPAEVEQPKAEEPKAEKPKRVRKSKKNQEKEAA